ncbi:hypothetical protein [Tumebacillus permanentifrigoris]|uniref:Uncharacterized protein n=1 Tax=Tumebacillus permanentifrigoris TaxID=378543 RepID=A0A316D7G9_9BACL|nr:hypothetical protein [Tumebacillus permanentifrigoris]PWK05329.1 hypothetical protein C7459_12481 [Tumebacillus permanentifrigoris]
MLTAAEMRRYTSILKLSRQLAEIKPKDAAKLTDASIASVIEAAVPILQGNQSIEVKSTDAMIKTSMIDFLMDNGTINIEFMNGTSYRIVPLERPFGSRQVLIGSDNVKFETARAAIDHVLNLHCQNEMDGWKEVDPE